MNKAAKWTLAIVLFIVIWSIGGAAFSILLAGSEAERYSGAIAFSFAFIAAVAIVNLNNHQSNSLDDREVIEQRVKKINEQIASLESEKVALEEQLNEK